jgi:hypothetical protein
MLTLLASPISIVLSSFQRPKLIASLVAVHEEENWLAAQNEKEHPAKHTLSLCLTGGVSGALVIRINYSIYIWQWKNHSLIRIACKMDRSGLSP